MSTILTDDERPRLPGLGPEWTDYWRKTVEQKMEAYADAREAAVLAKLAQPADRHALQNQGKHPAPCARFCESKAYEIEIRQLKSQLGQADRQRVPDWRPIETAPKDGTAILVSEGRFARCVEWNDEYEWWAVDDNKLGPFRLRGAAPTHWMPLPAAPDAAPEAPAQEKSNG